jgi:hypothetical protein
MGPSLKALQGSSASSIALTKIGTTHTDHDQKNIVVVPAGAVTRPEQNNGDEIMMSLLFSPKAIRCYVKDELPGTKHLSI